MATKKLQILDYKIKQADNANTVGGLAPEHFATAADMTAMQDAMTDVQSKVGDTSVSEQITTGIANKVDKVDGKGLSTNDYTTAEKNKLAGIASGAEVNQNAFSNVVVGSTTIAADGKTDTLTLVAGDNVTLTPDATNDKVTITAKDTVYTHPSYTAKSAGLYKVTVDATGHVSATTEVTKSDITALGIPGQDTNTTYSVATTSADGLMSASDKTKLDGIATGANKTVVDSALSSTSTNPVQNKVINTEISSLKTLVGDTAVSTQISNYAAPKSHTHDYIPTSQKGAANGVAELDSSGKVPAAQLPSYVDDVLEYTAKANFPATGEAGKIYVDTTTNLTYRWSGSGYTEISPSLALGTTSSTAFRGDYGNTAYAHATAKGSAFAAGLYKITTNDQGHVTAATAVTKADITGLGIPAQDTTYGVATTSANGLMSASDKTKLDGIATGANKTVIDSALSTTSTNPVQNKIVTTEINSLKGLVGDTAVSTQISNYAAPKSHTHSAYVNQNAFSNVTVGSTTVAADSATDTLTLVAGSNVTLTPDATNDKITIAAKDTVYTHPSYTAKSAGLYKVTVDATGHVSATAAVTKADITALGIPASDTNTHYASGTIVNNSTTATSNTTSALTNGNVYLNHIENGAVKNSHKISGSGATSVTSDTSGNIVISSTNTTYGTATTSANGLMSSSDKSKLDGIATGANKTTVDSSLSTSSTNPVQNKLVTTEINSLKTLVGDTAVATQITNAISSTKYAGSASVGGSATSAVKLDTATAGSTTQPVYFTGGKPSAISYTIAKSVPSNAVFTDVNVTQTAVTASDYTNWRSLVFGQGNNASEGFSPANATGVVYSTSTLSCQPSTGSIRANVYKFGSNAKIEYDSTNKCLNFVFA